MGSKQYHFVFVHGAGHGAWCWYKLAAVLEKAGHRVTAVDLASAGENSESADDITSLDQYNRPLEDLFKSLPDDEKVVLVGHSLGGMSLALMSEKFAKKVSVAVYAAAFMPTNGVDYFALRTTNPEFLPKTDEVESLYHSKVEGGPVTSMEFPFERLKKSFYNECSEEDFAFALPRLKKFPKLGGLIQQVSTTKENYGTVPRVYILALHDRSISPASARIICKVNPPDEIYEIDADHSFFFSGVEDVTKNLNDIAEKYAS